MYNLKAAIKKFIELSDEGKTVTIPIAEAYLEELEITNENTKKVGPKYCPYYNKDRRICITPSIGVGGAAYVPALVFLGEGQSTTDGIYPVLLYYNKLEDKDKQLILAYGYSKTNKASIQWILPKGSVLIKDHFSGYKNKYPVKKLNYQESYIYNIYKPNFSENDFDRIVHDVTSLVDYYIETVLNNDSLSPKFSKNTEDSMCKEEVQKFSIRRLIELIHDTGLIYSDNLVKRFTFSLMTKPFVILSGLAGSGKTQLALAFAEALVKDKKKQMCVVSVGADWTNREPLLGFPNALQSGQYVKPESGVLDLLIEANKPENADIPFFLVLDEMNMSYVERYFADFLSAMESHEAIRLWDYKNELVPMSVSLPRNLFIIGTINVDETTYMFSPKVLDRANVIEFKISEIEMDGFLHEMKETHRECIWGKASAMASNFVEIASKKELANDANTAKTLQNFFKELKSVNAEFGYRSATEIFRFISQADNNDEEINGKKLTKDEILDAAIVQKLLPKLHGSRKKLEPVLQRLWKLCFAEEIKDIQNITADNIEKAKYKESADKISRMYDSANVNGFTSFAEA